MKKATIDLINCKIIMELHERIEKGLDLEEVMVRTGLVFGMKSIETSHIIISSSKAVKLYPKN